MPDPRPPRVLILATGGTIAGQSQGAHGYQAGRLGVEQIVHCLPETVRGAISLRAEQISNVGSQSINAEIWHRLIERIGALQAEGNVDAVVVTHGTDTMEETAWILALACESDFPVVFTGAMRPADAPGADGPANLIAAIRVASDARAKDFGPLVVMNDRVHLARHVQKMCAGGLEAFASPNQGPVATVYGTQVVFQSLPSPTPSPLSVLRRAARGSSPKDWPKVYVLFVHADMDIQFLNHILSMRPAGVIVAGVGNGNLPEPLAVRLAQAACDGLVVVRSSRTAVGDVRRNVEVDDDRLGFVAGRGHSPQKARILLACALAVHGPDPIALQAVFDA